MCCNIVRLCGILVMKLLGCEHTYVSLEGSTGEFMLGNMGDRVGELCLRPNCLKENHEQPFACVAAFEYFDRDLVGAARLLAGHLGQALQDFLLCQWVGALGGW